MNIVSATWTNGQLHPNGVMDWPEGTRLQIVPVDNEVHSPEIDECFPPADLYADEARFKDDPESIEAWCRGVEAIEPLEFTPEEIAERDAAFAESRRFNLETVRKAMFGGEKE
ncbi:hypothetical protein BH11PLA2_BH11PLA2_24600 [soil metagenome]